MLSHGINVGGTLTVTVGPPGTAPTRSLVFPVVPDQNLGLNVRVTVVQTAAGLYLDKFGPGIQTLTLQGTTAWNSAQGRYNGQRVDGNTAARHLYKDILTYHEQQTITKSGSEMRLYDDVANQAWVVEPIGTPTFQRSQQSPLTLYYSMQFVVIKDLMTGHQIQKAPDPVISTFTSPKSIQTYAASKVANAQAVTLGVKQTPYVRRQVQSGDTLYTIAQDYLPKQATVQDVDTFVNDIAALNSLGNPNLLFTGMLLRIPA